MPVIGFLQQRTGPPSLGGRNASTRPIVRERSIVEHLLAIRRAIRVLAIVGELHKRGYQRLRVMPFMSPSGAYWRCWIAPVKFFYRNHGAILREERRDPFSGSSKTTQSRRSSISLQPLTTIFRCSLIPFK